MEEIRGWPFGPSVRTRVVAAIDLNHNGRAALADRLVEAAVSSGCDGVKFLIRHTTRFYAKDALAEPFLDAPQLGTTLGEVMERLELPLDELLRIRAACRNRIAFIAAPHDDAAVDACGALEPDAVQVDYPLVSHHALLGSIASLRRPVLLCAAMCTDADLAAALEAIGPLPVTLLHCVGGRPDVSETALGLLAEYRRLGTVREVGYLGFEPGIAVAAAARALGATVIEKLLTLDRDFDGPWHRQSIDPATMKQLVDIMGGLDFSLNAHGPRRLLAIELEALAESGLSLVTAAPLKAHSVVRAEDIMVRGALRGLTPRLVQTVIGKRVLYDLPADAPITFGVLEP